MSENNYTTELLTKDSYKIFRGLYNDFYAKAIEEYKFELEPLDYDGFIDAVDKGSMQCVILKDNEIPTAFLVYNTYISESIDLDIIHCLGTEDEITRIKLLMEKFLELTATERMSKVVSFPMLGHQSSFTADLTLYGFKFIGLAVLRFMMGNASSERILENMKLSPMNEEYKVVSYSDAYKEDAINVIHNAFKDTQDAIYDTRYKSLDGTKDIINKFVEGIYGEFLPEATSVLLHNGAPVGFAFANITGGKIANIPLVGIDKAHRGKGFSEHLLNRSIKTMVDWTKLGKRILSEVNVTTETNNYKALKLYRRVGFREDYCYPQAYLLQKK